MRVPLLVVGALVLCVTLTACDEKLSDLTGPTPNLQPTFSSIQHEIFETSDASGRLACVQCHANVAQPPAGLNLTSAAAYANLVGVASREKPALMRVAPGDPDNSYMVHKLEGGPNIIGTRMPRGNGPFLSANQMLVIRRWIANGALNN
jgi:hypothetical protein